LGAPVDRRSDIFSLGIVLYEITLGKRLYHGASEFQTLKRIVEEPIPAPRQIDPDYPRELEEIVMHALEKSPEKRYQTARRLQVDLEGFAQRAGMYISPIALQGYLERITGNHSGVLAEMPEEGDGLQLVGASSVEAATSVEVPLDPNLGVVQGESLEED